MRGTRHSGGRSFQSERAPRGIDDPEAARRHLRLVESTGTARDTPAEIVDAVPIPRAPGPAADAFETWDEMVRTALASDNATERIRDHFEELRGWMPGTVADLAVLKDRAALVMLRRFLRTIKKAGVAPPSVAYRSGHRLVREPPGSFSRKVHGWDISTPYSWTMLLPSGALALQAHPDERSTIITRDGRDPIVVAGINAPAPYGLSVEDVATFALERCRINGVHW